MTVRLVLASAFTIALASVHASQPAEREVAQLGWMAGCWTRALPDGVNEEQWMRPLGGSLLGMSRTVRGGRTSEFEFLRIAEVDGALAYVARPSGQAEAIFRMTSLTEREVVFENPRHDFPQRIIYRRNGDAALTARIEGTMNGQQRGVDFPYTRCN